MAKAIGSLRTGGRKKSTPNKRTVTFSEALETRGIDLVGEILDAAMKLPECERIGIYMSLLPYQFPKRKPVETLPLTSIQEHLNQLTHEQQKELHSDLSQRLGVHNPHNEMTEKEKKERLNQLEKRYKQMIRDEEELGIGPD